MKGIIIAVILGICISHVFSLTHVVGGDFSAAQPIFVESFGVFDTANTVWRPSVQRPPGTITAVFCRNAPSEIYIAIRNGGQSFVYLFDGIEYHELGFGFTGTINSLDVNGNTLYAAGPFNVLFTPQTWVDPEQRFRQFASFSLSSPRRTRWSPLGTDLSAGLGLGAVPRKVFAVPGTPIFALGSNGQIWWHQAGAGLWTNNVTDISSNLVAGSAFDDIIRGPAGIYYGYGGIGIGTTIYSIATSSNGVAWTGRWENTTFNVNPNAFAVADDTTIYYAPTAFPGRINRIPVGSTTVAEQIVTVSGAFSDFPEHLLWVNGQLLVTLPSDTVFSRWASSETEYPEYRHLQRYGANTFAYVSTAGEVSTALAGGITDGAGAISGIVFQLGFVFIWGNFDFVYNLPAFGLVGYDSDSNEWSSIGRPLLDSPNDGYYPGSAASTIRALSFSESGQYAIFGGVFASIDNKTVMSIAKVNFGENADRTAFATFPPSPPAGVFPGLSNTDSSGFLDIPGKVNVIVESGANDEATEGVVWVGGVFSHSADTPLRNIGAYNFSDNLWYTVGGGVNGEVNAIFVDGDLVYVGGSFTIAGGVYSPNIAVWDEAVSTWSSLATGLGGTVFAITKYNGHILAGGSFGSASGVVVNGLALWDGEDWEPLYCAQCELSCKNTDDDYDVCLNGGTVYELKQFLDVGLFVRHNTDLYKYTGRVFRLQNQADVGFTATKSQLLARYIPAPDVTAIAAAGVSGLHVQANPQLGALDLGSLNWKFLGDGGFNGAVWVLSGSSTLNPVFAFIVSILLLTLLI